MVTTGRAVRIYSY